MNEGQQLARGLRAAYWAMHRRTGEALAAFGVTGEQFALLTRLADEDGITQQELAHRASSDPNTIRPMLRLLERRGLVRRRPHPSDGRANCVILTAAGRRGTAAMMEATAPCRQKMLSAVKRDNGQSLLRSLLRIAQVLESGGDPGA